MADKRALTSPAVAPAAAPPRRLLPVLAPVAIFAAVAVLFAFALQKGDPSKLPSALVGRGAPQMVLPEVPGLERGGSPVAGFTSGDLAKGRPTVINFFASWCAPCTEEHPQLMALAKRTGVTIYGINHKDRAANAIRFLAQHGNPYAKVGADLNGRAGIEWGVYGMPETFVVDGKGTVVYKHVGPITPTSLETQVLPALAKAGL